MQESKIVATKRLQDEGHWNEASLYREGIRARSCLYEIIPDKVPVLSE